MKYCTKCGQQIHDEAVICVHCGCPVDSSSYRKNDQHLLEQLSQRANANGIIWLVIGIVQVISVIGVLMGVFNIIGGLYYMKYSKTVLENPKGIVEQFEPLAGAIFSLVFNLIFGGVIGVVCIIYYLVSLRGLVMENRDYFEQFDCA